MHDDTHIYIYTNIHAVYEPEAGLPAAEVEGVGLEPAARADAAVPDLFVYFFVLF